MSEVLPDAPRIDRVKIALVALALLLAAALALVLFTSADDEPVEALPTTTTSTPTTTTTATGAGRTTTGLAFTMPLTFQGSWVSTGGNAAATFSETELQTLESDLPDAPFDGSLTLVRPAPLDRVPTAFTPSSTVLTLQLELNGVATTLDAVAVLAPTEQGLSLDIDLEVDLSAFDLPGGTTRVPIVLVLVPGS